MTTKIEASAARPYGHVPGHDYLDVDIVASGRVAVVTVVWGSAQGYDEEHGRTEYARTGYDLADAIEEARDAAIDGANGFEEEISLIETAAARALRQLAVGEEEAA